MAHVYVDDGYVVDGFIQNDITIIWSQYVIFIPKSELTIVQTTPVEIRELDLNVLRMKLKDLEDGEEGIPYPRTHNHNPPVNVGGVTLARVVEILDPYTITFEDGQYAVNLFGANSNVGDRVNVNQVSVRSSNSAGLVNSAEIEYGSFGGAVCIDVINGVAGALYPTGTPRQPVNNLSDAILIAERRGFTTFKVTGSLNIINENVAEYTFYGQSPAKSIINILPSANVFDCHFDECTLTGTLDGGTQAFRCAITNMSFVNGGITECFLMDQITMGGTTALNIINCVSGIAGPAPVIIDMGGDCGELSIRNFSGAIKIQNKTGADGVSIDLSQGSVILDSTVTNGDIICRGVGQLTNNATGSAVVYEQMLDPKYVNIGLYTDGAIHIDTEDGVAGTLFPIGTAIRPVNNINDAKTIADALGVRRYKFHGTLVINADHEHWYFEGLSSILTDVVVCSNTVSMYEPKFVNCTVTGNINTPSQQYERCFITALSGVRGLTIDSAINGTITLEPASSLLCQNVSVANNVNVNINGGSGSLFQASVINSGTFTISGATAGAVAQVGLNNMGSVTLAASNTAGSIFQITGIGTVVNNTTGATVVDNTSQILSSESITQVDELHKLAGLQAAHPLVVSSTGRTVSTITQTFSGEDPVTVTRTP